MNKYIYRLDFHGYEDGVTFMLTCEKLYTTEQFNELVRKCIINVFKGDTEQ